MRIALCILCVTLGLGGCCCLIDIGAGYRAKAEAQAEQIRKGARP